MRKRILFFAILILCGFVVCVAQQSLNVLFVGNSYTQVNNLPQMVKNIASSMGDELNYQSNTPGGCTFYQHCYNNSMAMICNGGWDIVVLQEQSQYPSFPQEQVEMEVFPYAQRLVDSIYSNNPCCEPMFYMTWGRKNGDADNAVYFPVLGTYEGMDSMLCERYTYMAQEYDASLCPVGRVWHYLRENHSEIELYQSDESHPSLAGTYAAACAFYVLFFHRNPELITFSSSLPQATAQTIRSAVRSVVFDNLTQWQRPKPQASFTFEMIDNNTVSFFSTSQNVSNLTWYFGEEATSYNQPDDNAIEHTYSETGTFVVSLVAERHCMTDTARADITIADNSSINIINDEKEGSISFYPNPAKDVLNINCPENVKLTSVILCDMYGKIVAQNYCLSNDNKTISLNMDNIASGSYILQINTEKAAYTCKTIITK